MPRPSSVSGSSASERCLHVVMFHYVRDVERTPFPRLHAMGIEEFRAQVGDLAATYEMATLESALAFLEDGFRPSRDLCLLTFDDGLREHYDDVLPILVEYGVQGLFFVITSCFGAKVASVHKNHFVMAALGEGEYATAVLTRAAELAPECDVAVDAATASRTYRWDTPAIARIKYLLNFQFPADVRDRLLDDLFSECFGSEAAFARDLYVGWEQAREMQRNGMLIGGHSHTHVALGTLQPARQLDELATCADLLRTNLQPQSSWPFSYPYGKPGAYTPSTIDAVRSLNFSSAFATTAGSNTVGQDRFAIHRIDPKDVRL